MGKQCQTLFLGAPKSLQMVIAAMKLRRLLLGRKVMTNLDGIFKSRDITLSTKVRLVKAVIFLAVMYGWELDHKESWMPKNWCFWTVVFQKTLERPLYCKELQPVHSKGDQSWVFFGRNDAEAETPVLWPPHVKSWLIGKDPDAGRDWGQEEKGTAEDEMAGWHHWLDGHVWVNSGSWWWTGRPGVLQFMGSQRVRHDWVTELNWTEHIYTLVYNINSFMYLESVTYNAHFVLPMLKHYFKEEVFSCKCKTNFNYL